MSDLLIDRRELASFEIRESLEPAIGLLPPSSYAVFRPWLTIEHAEGASGLESTYRSLLSGELDPSAGFVISPTDAT